jgi:hypothetical protein
VVDPARTVRIQAEARWQEVVRTFEAAGARTDPVYVAANAASALNHEVREAGWSSPRIPALVAALTATANPDGGYGLARPWDAFQDGTVNPEATSYTATTAGHVGPTLLAGYLAGAVPEPVVERAIDSILDLPRAPRDVCVPYSSSPNDVGMPCVWNVHFGAAAWVKRASAATGHRRYATASLVADALTMLATITPDPATGYLPYASNRTEPQDIGHQLWTATSIDYLRGDKAALTEMVRKPFWRQQARRFRDYNVASAMSGIALFDCRYATDPLILAHAASMTNGNPYAYKALAAQAREVLARCFPPSGQMRPLLRDPLGVVQPGLG